MTPSPRAGTRVPLLGPTVLLLVLGAGLVWFARPSPEVRAAYYDVPAFTLLDQRGEPYGHADLVGKVWVANFIFTHCPSVCRDLTQRMADVMAATASLPDVRLVSFSVDPENDTPERLAAYAEKSGADPARWRFVTGEYPAVEAAIVKGFRLPMDPTRPKDAPPRTHEELMTITHGTRLVLVDRAMGIRGYYEADDAGVASLLADLKALAD